MVEDGHRLRKTPTQLTVNWREKRFVKTQDNTQRTPMYVRVLMIKMQLF